MKKINFGNLGAFINLLSYVFGGALSIIGCFMILINLKELSKKYNDNSIFKNYLYAYIIFISGLIFMTVYFGYFALDVIGAPESITLYKTISVLLVCFGVYLSIVAGAYFIKKAYINLSKYMDNPIFNKIGKLYFYGALLSIVGIGMIMVFIAQFLEIKAYSDISDKI